MSDVVIGFELLRLGRLQGNNRRRSAATSGRIEPNNLYEDSKLKAEYAACKAASRDDIRLTLLRPTVVVGNSVTKSSGGSASGLYGL